MRRIVLLHSPSMNHSLFAVCVFSFFLWNHASVWDERRIITNFQHRISTLINGKFFSSRIKLDSCAFLINSSLLFRSDARRIESWNWKINDSWRLQKKEMFGFLSHATSESSFILNDHRQIIRSNSILRSWGLSQHCRTSSETIHRYAVERTNNHRWPVVWEYHQKSREREENPVETFEANKRMKKKSAWQLEKMTKN